MRRIFASVSDELYKALRHHAVDTDRELQDIIAEALQRYLGLKEAEAKKK